MVDGEAGPGSFRLVVDGLPGRDFRPALDARAGGRTRVCARVKATDQRRISWCCAPRPCPSDPRSAGPSDRRLGLAPWTVPGRLLDRVPHTTVDNQPRETVQRWGHAPGLCLRAPPEPRQAQSRRETTTANDREQQQHAFVGGGARIRVGGRQPPEQQRFLQVQGLAVQHGAARSWFREQLRGQSLRGRHHEHDAPHRTAPHQRDYATNQKRAVGPIGEEFFRSEGKGVRREGVRDGFKGSQRPVLQGIWEDVRLRHAVALRNRRRTTSERGPVLCPGHAGSFSPKKGWKFDRSQPVSSQNEPTDGNHCAISQRTKRTQRRRDSESCRTARLLYHQAVPARGRKR
jgi:hypothetical protein